MPKRKDVTIPYVTMPCYLDASLWAFDLLQPFKPYALEDPFAYHMSFLRNDRLGTHVATTKLLVGTFKTGGIIWDSPVSFGDQARDLSLGLMQLVGDWRIDDIMTGWISTANLGHPLADEITLICFKDAILIENGSEWPIHAAGEQADVQDVVDHFLIPIINEGISAHRQMVVLEHIHRYIKHHLKLWNPSTNRQQDRRIETIELVPRSDPKKSGT